ncbi:PEP-CTERM sorting domain-containing protein [Candidatus Desantisbacteria bacterium]|nr:PEP-CTERM sorting domain-containing protein [Candidatus Desantisbacteria bacterium]MBI4846312.1 PEP-CTERM sorting domain-containing protein [Candidatus Omnitrophota bacterium]
MKRGLIFILFIFILFLNSNAYAIIFTVDADLNSITSTYYQNIIPPYSVTHLDTNLFLNNGDFLEISASGTWSNAPTSYNLIFGPNGNPNENIALSYPGAGYPVAALMGKIGDGDYFFIGSSYSNYVTENGILYLGFNATDYGNNWGTVNADVNITETNSPVPEPATMLLFGPALLSLICYKRKNNR